MEMSAKAAVIIFLLQLLMINQKKIGLTSQKNKKLQLGHAAV